MYINRECLYIYYKFVYDINILGRYVDQQGCYVYWGSLLWVFQQLKEKNEKFFNIFIGN